MISCPLGTPTVVQVYADEMRDSTSSPITKISIAAIITALTQVFGWNLFYLATGLLVAAILDTLLSLIPGNVKEGTEKDHTIQAKFFAFITNFIGLFAIVIAMEFLKLYADESKWTGIISSLTPYVVSGWIYGILLRELLAIWHEPTELKFLKR